MNNFRRFSTVQTRFLEKNLTRWFVFVCFFLYCNNDSDQEPLTEERIAAWDLSPVEIKAGPQLRKLKAGTEAHCGGMSAAQPLIQAHLYRAGADPSGLAFPQQSLVNKT